MAMARGFVQIGAEVTIAYPRRSSEPAPPLTGVRFLPYGPMMHLVFPWLFPFYRIIGLFGLRRLLQEVRPDVCLVNDPVQAAFFPRPWNLFWDVHDLPDPRLWTRRWLIRRVLSRAQGVISTSQRKLDRLASISSPLPPALVVANPVTFDPAIYRTILRTEARAQCGIGEKKAIVYAGQLYDWKGVDTLVSSAAFLPSSIQIHIIGGIGKDLERCEKLTETLPASAAGVFFHGQRPADEIPHWLRAADIVVIPNSGKHRLSVEDTNPLKAIEAMAAEATIVASDLPTLRETLAGYDRVRFFHADDPKALASEILSMLATGAQRERGGPPLGTLLTAKERAHRIAAFVRGMMS